MANHLEQLISEWLEFKGYFVHRNVKVGKLAHGGHAGLIYPFPEKPKGMHWRTYIRLQWKANELEYGSMLAIAERHNLLGGRGIGPFRNKERG